MKEVPTWIFLDVDGVLNCSSTTELTPEGFTGVEDGKIALLAELVRETGAKVVLTSTWKDQDMWFRERNPGSDLVYLLNKLAGHGVEIEAYTKDGDRGRAVRKWLDVHPGYVVIFDDQWVGSYADAGVARFLVQTTMKDGLQPKHIRRAKQLLETQRKKKEGINK